MDKQKLTVSALFDLSHSRAGKYIAAYEYPWQVLPHIKEFIYDVAASLPADSYNCVSDGVWIAKSASISDKATIIPPCIIGENTEVRTGAFIRGNAIVGDGCVVGNSCELKNAILFDSVQVPHFNYIGDSILGYKSHTGAGAITSNVKSDKTPVTVNFGGEKVETGLKKFGAILGDCVEVGCNSVLNPGTVIGKNTNVYPLTPVRGYIPEASIVKSMTDIVSKQNFEN